MNLREYFLHTDDTQEKLGARIGVTQGAISQYLQTRIPSERVLQIERETGGMVSRHVMRPDIYPLEKK